MGALALAAALGCGARMQQPGTLRGNQLEANAIAQRSSGAGQCGDRQARILCVEQTIQRGTTGVHLLGQRRFSDVARSFKSSPIWHAITRLTAVAVVPSSKASSGRKSSKLLPMNFLLKVINGTYQT